MPNTGAGVQVASVDRLRDTFLETRGHQEHALESNLRRVQGTYARAELAFAEPGENGIANTLSELSEGWATVANDPTALNPAARGLVLERAATLVTTFNTTRAALAEQRTASIEQLEAVVTDVSSISARVADVNDDIRNAVNGGFSPNDLMDQRDQLIRDLSELVGVTVRPADAGMTDVYVGGAAIVRGNAAISLEVDAPAAGPVRVRWANDGSVANVSGEAGGLLTSVNDVLPRHRDALTAVTDTLRDTVNALHTSGTDLNGNPGLAFFTNAPNGDLAVNAAILADGNLIAASATGAPGDGSVAASLAELNVADKQYQALIVDLGVEGQGVNRRVSIQAPITAQVDAARDSESGVNLDEEMVNMLSFQHAYAAAARFLTAVDSTLDTLINRTGLVGR